MLKRLSIVLGVILALVGVVTTKIFLDRKTQVIQQKTKQELIQMQERQASILVANVDIPPGVAITPNMLGMEVIPKEYVQPKAVSAPERILGMVAAVPISKGEQITLSKLILPQQQTKTLALSTPVGKRAISISVDNLSSLVGLIRPGDYVDVIAMIPLPELSSDGKQTSKVKAVSLFQNVLVLAVGQETSRQPAQAERREDSSTSLITLALLPSEANLIAFVQEQAKIRLVLRSPIDSQIELVQPAGWDTLFQYIAPQALTKSTADKGSSVKYIEIHRGLNKERVPLSE
jgi:pilus assembly protein CpaB